MSIDWIIEWPDRPSEPLPDKKVIIEVIEDFLGAICYNIKDHGQGMIIVSLLGNKSNMFQRNGGIKPFGPTHLDERWFEVWVTKSGLTITTRVQDDVTNCLAGELAQRCARRWNGKINNP